MIKSAFYIAILMWSSIQAFAQQNLVVNGDFEEYSSCPDNGSSPGQTPYEIQKCSNWIAPTFGTSDYFNSCSSNPLVQTPGNFGGIQIPYSGNGYLGFASIYQQGMGTDGYSGNMWWEYIQGRLIQPLENGKIYKFSMEVSLAEYSDLMITELGAYFSSSAISSPNTASLNIVPQCKFSEPNYFRDTVNWIHFETLLMASGNEQYVTIGNFRNDVTNDTLRRYDNGPVIGNPFITYFYVDHVMLTDASSDLPIANIFTPNDDGINDQWKFPFSGEVAVKKISILNRWGNLIYEADLNGFSWDGKTEDGNLCSEGTYFYRVSGSNIAGFIELMK